MKPDPLPKRLLYAALPTPVVLKHTRKIRIRCAWFQLLIQQAAFVFFALQMPSMPYSPFLSSQNAVFKTHMTVKKLCFMLGGCAQLAEKQFVHHILLVFCQIGAEHFIQIFLPHAFVCSYSFVPISPCNAQE